MSPTREILVADDDEHDLTMIKAAFAGRREAPELHCVHDGGEALDFLYSRGAFKDRPPGDPAMLLLDLHMPRVNGWEVLRQIKGDEILRSIPVVVFSSSAREPDVRRCYDLGVNAYVVKPIDFAQFQEVVRGIEYFWLHCNVTAVRRVASPPGPRRRRTSARAATGTP